MDTARIAACSDTSAEYAADIADEDTMGLLLLAVGFGVGIVAGALIDRKLGRGHLGEQHSIGSHISESEATYRHPY